MLMGIRGFAPTSNSYDGLMDEIMLFNSFVGAVEAASIFDAGRNNGVYTGASSGNLVSHWGFDDGTANDYKGTNNGTLFNQAEVIITIQNFYNLGADLTVDKIFIKDQSNISHDGISDVSTSAAIHNTSGAHQTKCRVFSETPPKVC